VVLAAGLGTRLRPLTDYRPKALCPIDNVPLLDLAIASVLPHAKDVAVNVHYRADDVRAHLAGSGVHISDETRRLLGSAGAIGHLKDWVDGRPVLVRNSDAFLTSDLRVLMEGWDGLHPRILGADRGRPSDFGTVHYVGACLLPARSAADLPDAFAGLYDLVWEPAWRAGSLEIVEADGECIDCGTPRDYLRANLAASGGASVVGANAVVEGDIDGVVVWDGGYVGRHERLRDCVRVGRDVTVDAH
jgi:MurNAc alpha-1-phosphate uridylyltransferase